MKLLKSLIVSSMLAGNVQAIECRDYTDEQRSVINNAYSYGLPHNYQHTLSAIVVKESFVGHRIIRYNPSDPSTGVTHIHYPTLKWLSGLDRWGAMHEAEKLIADDLLSFHYSILKLDSIKGQSVFKKLRGYNGSAEYAHQVLDIMRELKRCGEYPDWG